jgi:hypothetical protein
MSIESTRPVAISTNPTDDKIESVDVEHVTPANDASFMSGVSLEAAFLQSGVCLETEFNR